MRNKRETDISHYTDKPAETAVGAKPAESGVKRFFKGLGKLLLTVFAVCMVAAVITLVSLGIYIYHLAMEPTGIDLKAKSMNQTSRIFVKDSKTGEFTERQKLYDVENRIWVDFDDIPEYMKEAQITIEDKRFFDHKGVDWTRTLSAVGALVTGTDSYGGSTITQQLIKNLTDDNEVSINRKLREITKALRLEQEYSKEQILEAYLNVVNYGNNCQGVEAAAQLYFGKSIKDCSLAECVAIAGITQNPSHWNPLLYPENNRVRRENILYEMNDQKKISDEELQAALQESDKMTFVGFSTAHEDDDEDDDNDKVQNWYYNQMIYDLRADLAKLYNISEGAASEKIYTEGLSIYSAMDEQMQDFIESAALNMDKSQDPDIQIGSVLMDFDGRVIATVGSSQRKTGPLDWDRATHSTLQPGSAIKPLLVYPMAIESKQLYYSSFVLDEPVEDYETDSDGNKISGPSNAYGSYLGQLLLPDAIERSSNATAVQTMKLIGGPNEAYDQATNVMGFKKLDEADSYHIGALSIGGMTGGVSVREMAAAFTYMGNGGLYYEPYTYYYVTDSEGNVIIDNRDKVPRQAYSSETATIMNRLLHYNMENAPYTNHTFAAYAAIPGWDIVGKTGTTDNDYDCWYCGLSPYAAMATWTGFDIPGTINDKTRSAKFFATVMGEYLKNREVKEYNLSPNVKKATYNPSTGLIVSTEYVEGKYVGYYTEDNMPAFGEAYYEPYTGDYNSYDSVPDATGDDTSSYEPGGETSGETSGGEESGAPGESAAEPGESAAEGGESAAEGGGESQALPQGADGAQP